MSWKGEAEAKCTRSVLKCFTGETTPRRHRSVAFLTGIEWALPLAFNLRGWRHHSTLSALWFCRAKWPEFDHSKSEVLHYYVEGCSSWSWSDSQLWSVDLIPLALSKWWGFILLTIHLCVWLVLTCAFWMSENWDSWTPKSGPIEGRKDSGRVLWFWHEAGFDDEIQLPHVPTIHKLPMFYTPSTPRDRKKNYSGLSGFSDRTNSTAAFGCSGATWTAIAGRAAGAVGSFVATSHAPISGGKKGFFSRSNCRYQFRGCLVGFYPKTSGIWPQDSSSSIADFYPREFQLDLKPGDKDWQVPCGWWFFMVFLPIVVLDTASKGQILLCDIS